MLKKNLFGMITLMAGVMLVLTLSLGCNNGGGDDGIVRPNIINGYYGVTNDGKTIEVIIEDGVTLTVDDYANKTYVIKVDGVEKSKGTVTKSGSTITFTKSTGDNVSGIITSGSLASLTVGSITSITMVTSRDHFYCIGGPTSQSEEQIKQNFLTGKTPTQIKSYLETYLNDYDYDEGAFDYIIEFGKSYNCPNKELTRISEEMNSGKFYGVGYYKHKEYGNIVYCVSRLPFPSY